MTDILNVLMYHGGRGFQSDQHRWDVMNAAYCEIERLRAAVDFMPNVEPSNTYASEAAVQQLLRVKAPELGCSLWRNNNGSLQDAEGRWIRFGLGNDSKSLNAKWKSSDLVGIGPNGRFLAIEVKESGWRMRPSDKRAQAQAKFMQTVVGRGGIAGFAQSTQDFERIIQNA